MKKNGFIIHTDGGSRGNPGPAASAFVVEQGGVEIYKDSKYLGTSTNNYAEYSGVIFAIEWLPKNSEATLILDSELVVRQLTGIYKVKNEVIKILFLKIINIIKNKNLELEFKHVPREKNKLADLLLNQELDKNQ